MSNKYIYVGIISLLLLGVIIVLSLTLFSSNTIEGKWAVLIDLNTISDGADKSLTKEEVAEQKEMLAKEIQNQLTFNFKDGKLLLGKKELPLSTWSLNGHNLSILPIEESRDLIASSSQTIKPWDYSKKSDWVLNFENDSIMIWRSSSDTSLSLKFKRIK